MDVKLMKNMAMNNQMNTKIEIENIGSFMWR